MRKYQEKQHNRDSGCIRLVVVYIESPDCSSKAVDVAGVSHMRSSLNWGGVLFFYEGAVLFERPNRGP